MFYVEFSCTRVNVLSTGIPAGGCFLPSKSCALQAVGGRFGIRGAELMMFGIALIPEECLETELWDCV